MKKTLLSLVSVFLLSASAALAADEKQSSDKSCCDKDKACCPAGDSTADKKDGCCVSGDKKA